MDSIAKINRLLAEKGMNGADLSRLIGVSGGTYSTWNTRRNKISSANLTKIAKALGVTIDQVLPDEDEEPTAPVSDMDEMLTYIKDNPGMRILFNKAKDATPEQLLAIAQMIDTFKNGG